MSGPFSLIGAAGCSFGTEVGSIDGTERGNTDDGQSSGLGDIIFAHCEAGDTSCFGSCRP